LPISDLTAGFNERRKPFAGSFQERVKLVVGFSLCQQRGQLPPVAASPSALAVDQDVDIGKV
jgi:hypothetical protein